VRANRASGRGQIVEKVLHGHAGLLRRWCTAVLDAARRPTEARPLWEKVLEMAEGYSDAETAATARARLDQRP